MENQVVLITGSTDGIGKAAAIEAARRGAAVIVHGRSAERVSAVQREISGITGSEPNGVIADFSSLKAVRDLAGRLLRELPRLDVLINNAGIISRTRKTSDDGYELTFAVNHLAPFLLTTSLLDLLRRSAPARVVTVSSMVHHGARVDFDDLMQERGYDGMRAYGQSKLANVCSRWSWLVENRLLLAVKSLPSRCTRGSSTQRSCTSSLAAAHRCPREPTTS